MPYDVVTFLTDYGLDDGYVGVCHAVIARIAPSARVVDVTHLIPPQNVRRGAVLLAQQIRHLAPAVHLAVVDPGVGTARRGVVIEAGDSAFVGPDNGLLMPAADTLGGAIRAFELTNPAYRSPNVSRTFHGRDVFAPAAAHIAAGIEASELGPPLDPSTLVRLPPPRLRVLPGYVSAEIVHVDRFGNLCTAARPSDVAHLGNRVRIGELLAARGETFGSVDIGEAVMYVDSTDHVAIAVNGGSASDRLLLREGDVVELIDNERLG